MADGGNMAPQELPVPATPPATPSPHSPTRASPTSPFPPAQRTPQSRKEMPIQSPVEDTKLEGEEEGPPAGPVLE
eukprot:4026916-Pyramimonas_sp.AAC.1